jgi:putative ABC transport system permease protein
MSVGISAAEQRLMPGKNENTYQVSLMGWFTDTVFPLQGRTKLVSGTYSSDMGFDLSDYADEVIRLDLFHSTQGEIKNYDKLLEEALDSLSDEELDSGLNQSSYLEDYMTESLHIIPLSQYNALRSQAGLPELTLAPGHACYYRDPEYAGETPLVSYLLNSGLQLDFKNRSYLIDPLIESVPLSTDHAITLSFGLIVPDEDIGLITPVDPNVTTLINFNFKPELIEERGLQGELALLNEAVQLNKSPVGIFSLLQVQAREMVITVSISYTCIYIGLIFLMCSAALLAIQQLTHLEENQQSFLTLSRLGATQSQLRRSVIRQVSTYFALPLGLALIDSVIAFLAINPYVQSKLSMPDLGLQTMYIGLLLVTVYGVYFLLTCISAVNAIERYTVSSYTK